MLFEEDSNFSTEEIKLYQKIDGTGEVNACVYEKKNEIHKRMAFPLVVSLTVITISRRSSVKKKQTHHINN